jgi:electron-transferring-flavoprotein dehydrogenase
VDEHFGLPPGHEQKDWAVGMKMVVQLPDDCELEAGMVLHTFGYPEPEIFGFLYVYPDRTAAVGIFVPSSFQNPVRTSYRYLQHYIMHPYLWRYLQDSTLLSWGAKSLQESGKHGEPFLAGDGYARIGEGSGSTNVLTGSGVDEAWATGTQLAEGVLELLRQGKPFTKENLDASYVQRRRASWVEDEGLVAEKARDGFHHNVITGLIGMGLTGLTNGRISIPGKAKPLCEVPNIYDFFTGRIPEKEVAHLRRECEEKGLSLHDALMDRCGWPQIPYDGKLLISHQDALLLGGKVQAPAGYADHVVFLYPTLCETCGTQVCVEVCSGQAITPGTDGVPAFDREKCIHCGACVWNCTQPLEDNPDKSNLAFKAGPGGLHSAQN